MIRLIPAPYRWAAWAVLAFALLGVGGYIGSRNEAARHANTKAKHAQVLEGIAKDARKTAEQTARLAVRIRKEEAASAATIAAIESRYLQELTNATRERDTLLSDLRSGRRALSLSVRTCPPFVPAAGAAAAAASRSDGTADSGAGDGRLVALADIEPKVADQRAISARADARLQACQATLTEYQRLTSEAAK